MTIPRIDPDVKYRGISELRKLNAKVLRELTSALVIQDHDEPIAVMVSYEMYLRIQSEIGIPIINCGPGGKANDDLFVTGKLGGSIRGRHLNFFPRIDEARWLTANFKVHAMMDLSDGLGTDLPRLAGASKLGFAIDERALPLSRGCTIQQAISGGEDYELLFAVSPRERKRLQKRWQKKFPGLPLTRIGRLNQKSKIKNQELKSGYVHFRQPR